MGFLLVGGGRPAASHPRYERLGTDTTTLPEKPGRIPPAARARSSSRSRTCQAAGGPRAHLGLTEGANDETKARHAFVYGDLRRVHRSALIACVHRAPEWRHKAVEPAAHDLLQELDRTAGVE
jgi:hypothetical protein